MPAATQSAEAEELIVLVDERGTPTGTAEKRSSHHGRTPLHLAFSCYVFAAREAGRPRPNGVEVQDCARISWERFAELALADNEGDTYSWWCKNQLRGHPVIERYARPVAGPAL